LITVHQFNLATGKFGEFIILDILATGKIGEFLSARKVDFLFVFWPFMENHTCISKDTIVHQP
jgi:hypothetical protein